MVSEAFYRSAKLGLVKQGYGFGEPDWSLIARTSPSAPAFPCALLGAAQDYVLDASAGSSAPPDYVAAMLLASVSALLGKRFAVQANSDWCEPLIIWSAMVGPPSSGKTPACKPVRQALFEIQRDMAERHEVRVQSRLQMASEDGLDQMEITKLEEALKQPPRCIVNDATAEALARIEMRAPYGLLVERDELSGLIEGLERYSAGVDRAYYLEAFNSGPFSIDRVKAGSFFVDNHCFGVTGGIQPDRLKSLLTHSGDDDGFMSRVLIFWPDLMPPGPIPAGADHSNMKQALNRVYQAQDNRAEDCSILALCGSAYAALDDWYQSERAGRYGSGGRAGSAYGKLPGYALRLSGVLHVLDWAFGSRSTLEFPQTISERHMVAALQLIESYFVPQIDRAYAGANALVDEFLASAILHECKTRGLHQLNLRVARREWGIPGARKQGSPQHFQMAAKLLVDANWLKPKPEVGAAKEYLINPVLFTETS